MNAARRSSLSLGLGLLVALAGCAAPTAEEESAAGNAAQTGAPSAAPSAPQRPKAGFYQSDNQVLRVFSEGGVTYASFEANKPGYTASRFINAELVSVKDHFELKPQRSDRSLTLTPANGGFDATGNIFGDAVEPHFAPRADGAYDGTYASFGEATSLTIAGSSATSMEFAYEFTFGAQTFKGQTTGAAVRDLDAISVTNAQLGECPVQFSAHRYNGKTYFYAAGRRSLPDLTFPEECKAIGLSLIGYTLRK
jgi:hypothetical protein